MMLRTCRSSALENLRDIGDFCRSEADPHRGAEWYILYFGFQASLTLLLFIVWEPGHVSSDVWRGAITEALQWFRQLDSVGQVSTPSLSFLMFRETDILAARSVIRNDHGERLEC